MPTLQMRKMETHDPTARKGSTRGGARSKSGVVVIHLAPGSTAGVRVSKPVPAFMNYGGNMP